MKTWRRYLSLFCEPRATKTGQELKEKWEALPPFMQSLQQIYGLNEEGCGATIGVMPRCDFACRGCYLSESANKVPYASLEEVKAQLRQLREYLGKWGNLQLTDGEVTLRPVEELIEILRYAKEIELIPMLMTHGDQVRKNPELLKRMMAEGGLAEVSFHVDITQRGRMGEAYKKAKTEAELMPLRAEFADLVRRVRKETGQGLRVASTLTITPDNVKEVPDLLDFYMQHSDVFRLVSFLPIAQVGRTLDGLGGGVSQDALWEKVSKGLFVHDQQEQQHLFDSRWWMGHPDCSQFLMGYVVHQKGERRYHALSMNTDRDSLKFFSRFFKNFAGITFRADSKGEAVARFLGMVKKDPMLFLVYLPKYISSQLKKMFGVSLLRCFWGWLKGDHRLERFTVVSHHFMGEDEVKSEKGSERLEQCVFKVSYEGELVSMCEFNTSSKRFDYYETLKEKVST